MNYYCHLHPLQAAKLYRNSRLVLDEDDLKWVINEKNIVIIKKFHENFRSKTAVGFNKCSHSSEMQNDALIHREDKDSLSGKVRGNSHLFFN